MTTTQSAIQDVSQLPQRQDSLTDQLVDLRVAANKLGLYDAADLLKDILDGKR